MKLFWVLCVILWSVSSNAAFAVTPFVVSVDGQEVTDTRTGLIWRRCAEGMVFRGGVCTGTATAFTHEAALTAANNAGGMWRLPNIKELSSIADKTRINPAIDPVAFPATPALGFWSASSYVGGSSLAWYVSFYYGSVVSGNYRNYSNYVRLVRASQ